MHIDIYTDGSSLGNPGPGGFAAVVKYKDENGEQKKIVKGGETATTNNRMEMAAIIAGLHWVSTNLKAGTCTVHSDSRLIIQSMREGWKRKKNLDLWAKMDTVVGRFSKIEWQWIKGHNGHPENEEADGIAVQQAMLHKRKLFSNEN